MASQTYQLAADYVVQDVGADIEFRGWSGTDYDEIDAVLLDGDTDQAWTTFGIDRAGTAGNYTYSLYFAPDEDLSDTFEAGGSLAFTVGSVTYTFNFDGSDTASPYQTEDAGLAAVFNALPSVSGTAAATVVLDDGAGTDTTAPTFVSAETDTAGTTVTLTFGEALDTASVPAASAFTLSPAKAISDVAISGSTVELTTAAFANGDTITVAYTKPSSNPIQDAAGNEVATFAAQSVTNNVPGGGGPGPGDTTPPAFSSAATNVAGTELVITFDEALDTGSVPALAAFNIQVAGSRKTGNAIAIAGSAVTVTFSTAITTGQAITVAYTKPSNNPLQDAAGNEVATFGAQAATNNVPAARTTTDTDYIYRRGTATPTRPTGGTSTESHQPTGWSRTALAATSTDNVYRCSRVRTYTDGTFTSATAWSVVGLWRSATGGVTPSTLQWHDGAPPLTDATPKLWRSHRYVPGNPAPGDSVSDQWSDPVIVGDLGRGLEFIFARTADANAPTAPSNSWGYDSPGINADGSGTASTVWFDAAPTLSDEMPFLWSCEREVAGKPTRGQAVADNWTPPHIVGRFGGAGPPGPSGEDGEDGQGFEYIFTRTSGLTLASSRYPSNAWTFDNPGTVDSQVWTDGAPSLTQAIPYMWRSERKVPGGTAQGDAVSDNWTTPVIVGHYGLDGVAGSDGSDGAGVEFIFARTSSTTSPSAPSNNWGFDQPTSPWFDGAPTLSATNPYLWMSQRRTSGFPSVGDAVSASWTSPRIVARYGDDGTPGEDGDQGEPGPPGPRVWTRLWANDTDSPDLDTTTAFNLSSAPSGFDVLHIGVQFGLLNAANADYLSTEIPVSKIASGTTAPATSAVHMRDRDDLNLSVSGSTLYARAPFDDYRILRIYGITGSGGGTTTTPVTDVLTASVSGDTSRTLSQTAAYSVSVAGGTGTISYQWQRRSGTSGSWSNVSTASSYSTSRSTAGTYQVRCVVTRGTESVTSNIVTTVWAATPTVTASVRVSDSSPDVGDSVTWSVSVGGTAAGAISYQWQRATSAGGTYSNVGTGSSYSVSRSTAGSYYVRCVVTRGGLSATSSAVAATWSSAQPATLTVTVSVDHATLAIGQTATWTATVGGTATGAISYQWQRRRNFVWSDLSGETGSTYDHTLSSAGSVRVRCVVTRGGLTATAGSVIARWSGTAPTLTVTVSASDTSPSLGQTVRWTANVGGTATGAISYQWQRRRNFVWSDLSGETGSTYDHTLSSAGSVRVRCVVTRGGQTATAGSVIARWS